jgi:hypothetical protein
MVRPFSPNQRASAASSKGKTVSAITVDGQVADLAGGSVDGPRPASRDRQPRRLRGHRGAPPSLHRLAGPDYVDTVAARKRARTGSICSAGTSVMRRAPTGTLVVSRPPGNRSMRLTDGVASPRSAAPGASPSSTVASGPPGPDRHPAEHARAHDVGVPGQHQPHVRARHGVRQVLPAQQANGRGERRRARQRRVVQGEHRAGGRGFGELGAQPVQLLRVQRPVRVAGDRAVQHDDPQVADADAVVERFRGRRLAQQVLRAARRGRRGCPRRRRRGRRCVRRRVRRSAKL